MRYPEMIIDRKIEIITNYLYRNYDKFAVNLNNSLFEGKAGISLYLFYASKYFDEPKFENKSILILESIIEDINKNPIIINYYNGLSGILWYIKHLIKVGGLSEEDSSIYEHLNPLIFTSVKEQISLRNYDFLHGALGVINYLLYDVNENIQNDIEAEIADFLIKDVKNFDNDELSSFFYGELGIAHGMSGLILLLTLINEKKITSQNIDEQIDMLISYIIMKVDNNYKDPHMWLLNNENRYSWCNGTIGILYSLYRAIKSNKVSVANYNFVNNAMLYSLQLDDHKKLGIIDSCLCHGTAGNMQIYNKLKIKYNCIEFEKGIDIWKNKTILYSMFEDGIAGYKTWDGEESIIDYSLFKGVSGVGLSLMSYKKKDLSVWDDFFLL